MKYWVKKELKPPHGKVYIIEDRCKGCGFCIEFCPQQVLQESEEFNSRGYHPPKLVENDKKCIGCSFCSLVCPEFAIYIEKEEENED
ncbi:MAG TPA: 4Fe-4S dicluster domain-containing protein [Thermoplasmatales archaeon]|nr:4Fe-4S dicluster domain-containing protein [Thermoplasmatales archaeon]